MHIEVPASDAADLQILPPYLCTLHVPHSVTVVRVFVAHPDDGRGGAVDPLPVDVEAAPRVRVLEVGVRLECLGEEGALNGDAEVDLGD